MFHCVFDLRLPMHPLRVPTVQLVNQGFDPDDPASEPHRVFRGEGSEAMSVRVLHDEAGRLLIQAIHNSDVSDGWEREGESDVHFDRFSEKIAYPPAINRLYYLMTHGPPRFILPTADGGLRSVAAAPAWTTTGDGHGSPPR